jgi:hypothetical protein
MYKCEYVDVHVIIASALFDNNKRIINIHNI